MATKARGRATMDARGRVTLPVEARRALHLEPGGDFEVEVVGGTIVLMPAILVPREDPGPTRRSTAPWWSARARMCARAASTASVGANSRG